MSESWVLQSNHWAETLLPVIWRASWQGGLFIAAIWVICKVCRTLPAASRSWLWWIASLQMLVRLVSIATLPLPVLPAQEPTAPIVYETSTYQETSTEFAQKISIKGPVENSSVKFSQPKAQRTSTIPLSGAALLLGGWLTGVGLCFAVTIRRLFATRRMLRSAVPIVEGPHLEILEEFSTDFRQKRPRLLESRQALCPLLAGWFRPAIVVPIDIAESLDDTQLRMALGHEFAHLRRRDLWLGVVPAITQSLFFFHPLAWLATHEVAATREAACDYEALRISGGSPAAFARLLLDTAQSRSSMAVLGTAFGFRLIQRRISMLKTLTVSNARRYRAAGTLVVALAGLCALPWSVTAQSASHGTPSSKAKKSSKANKTSAKKHVVVKSTGKKATRLIAASTGFAVPTLPTGGVPIGQAVRASSTTKRPSGAVGYAITAPMGFSVTAPAAAIQGQFGITRTVPAGGIPATAASGFGRSSTSAATAPRGGFSLGHSTAPAAAFGFGGSTGAFGTSRETPAMPAESEMTVVSAPSLLNQRDLSHPSRSEITDDGNNVELDRAELHSALVEIFKAKHCNFIIKSDVEPDVVTASLHGMSIEGLLRSILGSVHQHLTYKRDEDGIFTVQAADK